MPRAEKGDYKKHTLHLHAGDYEKLQEIYPDVGAAAVVRRLVHAHLAKLEKPLDLNKIKIGDLNV